MPCFNIHSRKQKKKQLYSDEENHKFEMSPVTVRELTLYEDKECGNNINKENELGTASILLQHYIYFSCQ